MILLVNVKVDFSFFPIFKLKEVKWHVNCKIVEKVQLRLDFFSNSLKIIKNYLIARQVIGILKFMDC